MSPHPLTPPLPPAREPDSRLGSRSLVQGWDPEPVQAMGRPCCAGRVGAPQRSGQMNRGSPTTKTRKPLGSGQSATGPCCPPGPGADTAPAGLPRPSAHRQPGPRRADGLPPGTGLRGRGRAPCSRPVGSRVRASPVGRELGGSCAGSAGPSHVLAAPRRRAGGRGAWHSGQGTAPAPGAGNAFVWRAGVGTDGKQGPRASRSLRACTPVPVLEPMPPRMPMMPVPVPVPQTSPAR